MGREQRSYRRLAGGKCDDLFEHASLVLQQVALSPLIVLAERFLDSINAFSANEGRSGASYAGSGYGRLARTGSSRSTRAAARRR